MVFDSNTIVLINVTIMNYDPKKSIKENAEENHCSQANVRKYIQTHNLDRRGDKQIQRWKRIMKLRKLGMSFRKIALKEGLSVTTVSRYLSDDFNIKHHLDITKISEFQRGVRSDHIKSVENQQYQILLSIIKLYLPSKRIDCDLTYSKGNFYKHLIYRPERRYDKYPKSDDVDPLEKAYELEPERLDSVVIDLPFIIRRSSSKPSIMDQRYESFRDVKELEDAYKETMSLAERLLKRGGILIVKTQDTSHGKKQIWVHQIVERLAEQLNFSIEDIFINISSHPMAQANFSVVGHARKYHSYFYVFRKNRV
jgi:predicted transcriptional regulator